MTATVVIAGMRVRDTALDALLELALAVTTGGEPMPWWPLSLDDAVTYVWATESTQSLATGGKEATS